MKPNFALSLSFDGLRLMHRVADGWHLVGQVALDDPDVNGALERLRADALTLTSDPIATKLLIPNDQIRYIAIDGTRAEEADVRAALDGTTPYALDELAYDYAKGGGRTYVAAVARETLAEAEAFAREHGFNPVSFAAVPEPFTFVGEAFFGSVAGAEAERDAEPVIVTGTVDLPPEGGTPPSPPADMDEAPTDPVAQVSTEDESDALPAVAAQAAPVVATPDVPDEERAAPPVPPITPSGEIADPAFEPAPDALPDPVNAAEPAAEPDPEPVEMPQAGRTDDTPEDAIITPPPPDVPAIPTASPAEDASDHTPEAPAAVAEAAPVFASRLRADRNEGRGASGSAPAPAVPAKASGSPEAASFSSRRAEPSVSRPTPPPLAVPTGKGTDAMPPVAAPDSVPASDAAPAPSVDEAGPTDAAPAITGTPAAVDPVDAARVAATLSAETPAQVAPNSPPTETTTVGGAVGGMFASRRMARSKAAAPDAEKATSDKTSRLTVFGARKVAKPKARVGGKPRFLGLILTAVLLVLLFAIAAFAALSDEGLARWFGGGAPETQVADAPEDQPEAEVDAPMAEAVDVAATAPEATAPVAAVPTASDTLATPTAPAGGHVLSPEEATRIYAATGVWQRAPRIPLTPRTTSLSGLQLGDGWQAAPRSEVTRLADAGSVAGDALIATPIDPPAPDATFNFGADGRVIATPEGSATPDGILVIAGTPPLNPPTRPGTVAPEITPQDQIAEVVPEDAEPVENAPEGVVVLNGRPRIAPPVRPGTTAPTPAPQAALIAEADAPLVESDDLLVLAGSPPVLPPVRPGTTAPVAEPEAPVADTESTSDLSAEEARATPQPPPPEDAEPTDVTGEDVIVVTGTPSVLPPARPGTVAPQVEAAVDVSDADNVEATAQAPDADTLRPRPRSAQIVQAAAARANAPVLGELTRAQAEAFRPRTRPAALAPAQEPEEAEPETEPTPEPQVAAAAPAQASGLQLTPEIAAAVQAAANRPDPFVNPTRLAVTQSGRPDTRPRNMARIVARAAAAQQQAAAQAAAVPRTASVAPSAPTASSVAQAATLQNEINLRDINLIGIYGGSSDRRALVRLGNGRYLRVTVGDRLDGGRVTGISANALSYNKRGRTVTLQVGG
ncbi:hypothetical protein [Thalassorhabdomicrobium marinisediminis]|nr:hypothetical protein [Thalassorhabdomicrobium marinisediminis]